MNEYAKYVIQQLHKNRTSDKSECDFTIKTETKSFQVHQFLLVLTSDFFKAMFESDMKEKQENEIQIDTISCDIMEAVVEFLYGNSDGINLENVHKVIEAADYLQINQLMVFSENFLASNLTLENVLLSWKYSEKYNLTQLQDACIAHIREDYACLYNQKEFLDIPIDEVEKIIHLKNNCLEKIESHCYQYIVAWVNYDLENRKKDFPHLFQLLELENLKSQFLVCIVSKNQLVLENLDCAVQLISNLKDRVPELKEKTKSSNSGLCGATIYNFNH